ncbi:MAG: ABC transporter ATP-binding protein/permease [Sphaerochaetaceae bacterium]|nr:ABC transporter ATP-binding protein/permease [Sphaerochaetaceae bacterium]
MKFDRKGGMKPQIKKGTFKRVWSYVRKDYGKHMLVILFCILLASAASLVSTVSIRRLIDNVIVPGMNSGLSAVWGDLLGIIATMAVFYIAAILANLLRGMIMADITQGTLMNLRNAMFRKMETLPIKYFDTNAHGEIMSTYTNDTDSIRELIGRGIPSLIESTLSVISALTMMLVYSLWLTLAVIAGVALIVKLSSGIAKKSGKYMMGQQKSLAAEEGFVEEMMEGQRVVKVFCHQDQTKQDFDVLNENLRSDSTTANRFGNILGPINNNMGNIMYVLLALFGTLMVHAGVTNISLSGISTISIGIIVSFLSMAKTMTQTIGNLSMQINTFTMGLAGASRIFELIDQESEKDEGYVTLVNAVKDENGNIQESEKQTGLWAFRHPHTADGSVTYTELKGDIVMEHVDFGYTEDKQVLFDMSLYAKPGQKIAFVGATGAGKTTVTNLINRFYDIADGKIRYDGININKIRKPDLRRSLGIVLQEVNLFTGTVLENIRYGRLDATDEECIEAAKLANADSFITRLPDGYNTMLTGNGSSLSQGQRQLISIARAAVANPPVLIMDEATSSIDTRTEALVQKGMDNLMKGRTVFVIAHRLSTIRNSNAIMVLDHGKIIERGTHEQLLEMKGTYWQLYTGAFELE